MATVVGDLPIIAANAVTLVLVVSVFVLTLVYRKRDVSSAMGQP